jgi:hypothetical protein
METKVQTIRTTREELEFSDDWIVKNTGLYAKQVREFYENHAEGWGISVEDRLGFLTVIAERVEGSANKSGWLRSGSLLYRLTDERHPQNCDEINVTMAQGSREAPARESRARHVLNLLKQSDELKEALKWALEWIDAVPDNVLLPAMPGFDRDYVNGLLELS